MKIRHWSHSCQCLGRKGKRPQQVLKDVVGVYSSHPSAPLSLLARLQSFDHKTFCELENKKQAIRVPAMRLSIYLLAAPDAPRCLTATVPSPEDPYWRKRYGDVPEADYKKWRAKIQKQVIGPLPIDDIRTALRMPEKTAKSISYAKYILNRMSYEGAVLRIGDDNLRANQLRYVATHHWIESQFDWSVSDKALAWLAGRYLSAFGPARVKDFQWWTGVTATRAKAAVAALKTVDVGDNLLLPTNLLKDYESFRAPKQVTIDLLPPWDSYTMGYAPDGRERFVSPDMQKHVYGKIGATGGNALAVVMVNGEVQGTWSLKVSGATMTVILTTFSKPTAELHTAIKSQFEKMAAFLGATKLTIT